MTTEPFAYNLQLDERGVLLARFSGVFDVDAWGRTRDEIITRDFSDMDLNDRPVVAEISKLISPASDWTGHTESVRRYHEKNSIRYGRYAIVTGGIQEANIMAHFYIEYLRAKYPPPADIKAFITFEDAYAWVTETDASADTDG